MTEEEHKLLGLFMAAVIEGFLNNPSQRWPAYIGESPEEATTELVDRVYATATACLKRWKHAKESKVL